MENVLKAFAFVVCKWKDEKFLLVHEPTDLCGTDSTKYWWPGGRLDDGEGFMEAAVRETIEEGVVKIRVVGVLSFDLDYHGTSRITLFTEPVEVEDQDDFVVCKSLPDFESVGAMWVDTHLTG